MASSLRGFGVDDAPRGAALCAPSCTLKRSDPIAHLLEHKYNDPIGRQTIPTSMTLETLTIRVRGEDTAVPSWNAGAYRLISTGRLLRSAQLFDDELVEDADFPHWEEAVSELKRSSLKADIFTFARPMDRSMDHLAMPHIEDNLAVLATSSYDDWWNALPQEGRKNVRLAAKRGIVARRCELDDAFVVGIKKIYDETPVRQGRKFWHYQRDLDRVRMMNATYLERSVFIGAYLEDELVGFVKYVTVDKTAVLIQILAMDAHREKRPIYALLRETIEQCHADGMTHLTYGKYDYGVNQDSSLKEFKRRNGFVQLSFPRYFVPMTWRGKVAIACGMHLGWRHMIPAPLKGALHRLRKNALQLLYRPTPQRNG